MRGREKHERKRKKTQEEISLNLLFNKLTIRKMSLETYNYYYVFDDEFCLMHLMLHIIVSEWMDLKKWAEKRSFSRKIKRKWNQRPSNQMVRKKVAASFTIHNEQREYSIKFHFKPISDTLFDHSVAVSFTKNLLNARYNIIFDFGCSFRSPLVLWVRFVDRFQSNNWVLSFHFVMIFLLLFSALAWMHTYNLFCFVPAFEANTTFSHKSDGKAEKNSDQLNSFNEQVGNNKRLTNKTIFFIRSTFFRWK